LPKSDAGILGVSEIKNAFDYRVIFKTQPAYCPGLARLVHQIDAQRRDEIQSTPRQTGFC
jgi:hypothetical protein